MSKVPANYYFIEEVISPKILEWQKLKNDPLTLEDENKQKLQVILLDEIMTQVYKVIKGTIFRAQLHKKEAYDICFEIAVEACVKALPRFNPEFGTAFNYMSLTAKKSIAYYLIKKRKKKTLSLDYEYDTENNLSLQNILTQDEKIIKNLEIENLVDTIYNILEESGDNKNIIKVVDRFRDYLFYTQGKYDKRDFFNWAKSEGTSSNLLRKFLRLLKENKSFIYTQVGVY